MDGLIRYYHNYRDSVSKVSGTEANSAWYTFQDAFADRGFRFGPRRTPLSVEPVAPRTQPKLKAFLLPALVVVAVCAVVGWAARSPVDWRTIHSTAGAANTTAPGGSSHAVPQIPVSQPPAELHEAVTAVNRFFEQNWQSTASPRRRQRTSCKSFAAFRSPYAARFRRSRRSANSSPTRPADALIAGPPGSWPITVLRTISPRLARSYVGTDAGQVIVYRRDRFRRLASAATRSEHSVRRDGTADYFRNRAVDRSSGDRLHHLGNGRRRTRPEQIGGPHGAGVSWSAYRTALECHDHPFAEWKQGQFQGLAALFGQAHSSLVGVEDKAKLVFEVEDRKTLKKHAVDPAVPFIPSGCRRRARCGNVWPCGSPIRRTAGSNVRRSIASGAFCSGDPCIIRSTTCPIRLLTIIETCWISSVPTSVPTAGFAAHDSGSSSLRAPSNSIRPATKPRRQPKKLPRRQPAKSKTRNPTGPTTRTPPTIASSKAMTGRSFP